MLRFGKITEVDFNKGYARVKFLDDDIVSAPLQFLVRFALVDKDNFGFDINEQVACLMDENSEQGVILGATFNDKTPPTSGGGTGIYKIKFSDESFIKYDRNAHEYEINVQGNVKIISTGTTTVEAETVEVAATTVNVDATVVNVDAESVSIDASNVDITGAVSITGEVTVEGGITASAAVQGLTVAGVVSISAPSISGGGFSASGGNASVSGTMEAAVVEAGGIDLATHKHGGVQTGGGQTGTPI